MPVPPKTQRILLGLVMLRPLCVWAVVLVSCRAVSSLRHGLSSDYAAGVVLLRGDDRFADLDVRHLSIHRKMMGQARPQKHDHERIPRPLPSLV